MAIIKNRIKSSSELQKFVRLLLSLLRYCSIIAYVMIVLYLLYFGGEKKFSKPLLEITGCFVSLSDVAYKRISEPIYMMMEQFIYLRNLKTENLILKHDLSVMSAKYSDMKSIEAENIALRNLLSVVKDLTYSYTTAKLVSILISPFSKVVMIGVGYNQGASEDQIVTDGKWLIGRIAEVSDNYATVVLISDPNSRVPIKTVNSQEKGILVCVDNQLRMIYLQNDHTIQEGEMIVTSGDGTIYPPNLAVGIVSSIKYGNVVIKQMSNLYNTDFVTVINSSLVAK